MMRFLLLLLLMTQPLRAEEYPAFHFVTGVAVGDVLNIRARPDAGSQIIGSLAPDARGVEVLGVEGGWALVNTSERSGFAALRYLAREPGPDWNTLESPLTCLGTEPFWTLKIDPRARTARYSWPEDPEGLDWGIVHLWPADARAGTAALGLAFGTAVLNPQDCSDGMSDRRYGISVDLFLADPATSRQSGCCRLGLS